MQNEAYTKYSKGYNSVARDPEAVTLDDLRLEVNALVMSSMLPAYHVKESFCLLGKLAAYLDRLPKLPTPASLEAQNPHYIACKAMLTDENIHNARVNQKPIFVVSDYSGGVHVGKQSGWCFVLAYDCAYIRLRSADKEFTYPTAKRGVTWQAYSCGGPAVVTP